MMRALFLVVLALLAAVCVSGVAVDTEMSLRAADSDMTPELVAQLNAVHAAVGEAEAVMQADEQTGEAAFVETGVEVQSETDADADSELVESLGLDIDGADDALFLELEAALDAVAEADSEADAEADLEDASEAEADAEAEVDAESEANAEAGSVTVAESAADQSQAAEPIVTEQMETQMAIDALGLVETEAEAEVDAEAETEADAEMEEGAEMDALAEIEAELEAELESEAEAEAEAESGEEQTATTRCGKKITWERKEAENPEKPQA